MFKPKQLQQTKDSKDCASSFIWCLSAAYTVVAGSVAKTPLSADYYASSGCLLRRKVHYSASYQATTQEIMQNVCAAK